MKILLATDSFKGSLTQIEVCKVMHDAISGIYPDAEVVQFPLSDGGDGFVDVIERHCPSERVTVMVSDPLVRKVNAEYLQLENGEAIIEVASACGLQHLDAGELNPLLASSYGVGELIAHALITGHRRITLGLGGTATNDAGAGMLSALGFRLLDPCGAEIPHGAEGLFQLDQIDSASVVASLKDAEILIASDVTNPLLGPTGASRTFGPQKGASEKTVELLEQALSRFDEVCERTVGLSAAHKPGAGAAGGIAASLMLYCGAQLKDGYKLVAGKTGFESLISSFKPDLIITGEGRFDKQSLKGKLPVGVLASGRRFNVPVALIAGQVALNQSEITSSGFIVCEALSTGQEDVSEAIKEAPQRLIKATQNVVSLFTRDFKQEN